MYRFLQGLKNSDGSFSLHAMGESDVRGTYTAVSVAMLTCIADDALFAGTAEWIARCQTSVPALPLSLVLAPVQLL